MNGMLIQGLVWAGALAMLVFYLKRRRNRKMLP